MFDQILARFAASFAAAEIRYRYRLVSMSPENDSITVTADDLDTGTRRTLHRPLSGGL